MRLALRQLFFRLFQVCGKTGRIQAVRRPTGFSWFLFPVFGLAGLVWFLIRVIPKPGRASYPCMKVAVPAASGFLMWIIGLAVSTFAFKKARETYRRTSHRLAALFTFAGLLGILWMNAVPDREIRANFTDSQHEPNQPQGTAKGIFPGRVVWVHHPDATNENCTNTWNDGWFLPKNNDQDAIDKMLSDGIKSLTGAPDDFAAWDAIFKFHNQSRGRGEVGYATGEKIFIKINATSSWSGNFNPSDLSVVHNGYYGVSETSPELVLSVLKQLVNTVGAAQADIYIGDPIKHIYKHAYDLLHSYFPNVHYMDFDYGAERSRERFTFTNTPNIFYSDRGAVMTGAGSDRLCTLFDTCEYLINIPTLKGHKRAGVTMFAKNHFGSQSRGDASHLHDGLVNPTEGNSYRQGYGLYRVQVDLMGHRLLGGKSLFCLMDALYAGPEAVYRPTRWQIHPFNNDWTSSVFLSQDPAAIESVGYDFLRSEYTGSTEYNWVQMDGVDDYLHQAADSANWPSGIRYDPENDGTAIGSLGAHEHWNNAAEKKYTRNLGTGNGIELVAVRDGSIKITFSFPQFGWYMISLPVIPQDSSIAILFPSALGGTAFGWNAQNGQYTTETKMSPKKGYWLAIPGPCSSTVTGVPLNSYTDHFAAQGWYMIGSVTGNSDFTNPNDNPDGSVLSPAFAWDPVAESYLPVTTLNEKQGYWVAVFEECDLTVGASGGGLAKTGTVDKEKWSRFSATFGSQPPAPPDMGLVMEKKSEKPAQYALFQNYPNPFNPITRIAYQMSKSGDVKIVIYDILGKQVRTLVYGYREADLFEAAWNGKDDRGMSLRSGMYLVQMEAGGLLITRKIMLLK